MDWDAIGAIAELLGAIGHARSQTAQRRRLVSVQRISGPGDEGLRERLLQRKFGMLTDERWENLWQDLVLSLQRPGLRQWWATSNANLSPMFVALVEEILAEEPERAGE